ncbi:M1 family aminopeptidase [Salibacter halophilus]|uniref:Aminopeptidase N n=1 Tax=Salibacter halophilus TaxID=1803916 RepID=A0A6N6M4C0_9FLAO|nr:M1 family aminopeptidase [Salibacter halophilus]KAB1064034.1 T9SS type A sorting domain-containing protein [Salibacter halophilus]
MEGIKKALASLFLVVVCSSVLSQTSSTIDYTYWRFDLSVQDSLLKGNVTHHFKVDSSINSFVLQASNKTLNIDSAIFHGQSQSFSHLNDTLAIQLSETPDLTNTDSITIYYTAKATTNFQDPFVIAEHNNKPLYWTLSQPLVAKNWWPTHEPLDDKADSVSFKIEVPNELTASSNGLLINQKELDSTTVFSFKHKYPIPAYLIAFAVGPYQIQEQQINVPYGKLKIENYILENEFSKFREDATFGLRSFNWFDTLLNVPYPYLNEKYGHTQMLRGGGMEHSTNSFMGNFDFPLYVHELAHQWFGNYITCSSWKHIWLNEGIATFFQGLLFERFYDGELWLQWKDVTRKSILRKPDGSLIVQDSLNPSRIFDTRLSYHKGSFVLHMLRNKIGHKTYFDALNNYLNDTALAFSYANTSDLKRHFENSCSCDLTEFFNDWVYGEGYPFYVIEWEQNGSVLSLDLEQFTSHESVEFFEAQVELKLIGSQSDSIIKITPESRLSSFEIDIPFAVQKIEFDPEIVLLADHEIVQKQDVSKTFVFPNPADESLNIKIGNPRGGLQEVEVYDLTGKLIFESGELSNFRNFSINTTAWQAGVYIVKTTSNYGIDKTRLVIQ